MYHVGDAVELTFTTTPGATVAVSLISPSGAVVVDNTPVAESAGNPGEFPYTFQLTEAGVWEAVYRASGTVTQVERFWMRARPVTGPPPLATLDEVVEVFRPLTPAEETMTVALLRRASAMVRHSFPNVDQQVRDGVLDSDQVAGAVIDMVLRVVRNPEGLRTRTTGPFTRAFDPVAASARLVLTDDEIAKLTPAVAVVDPVASVQVTPGLAPCRVAFHPALGVWRDP